MLPYLRVCVVSVNGAVDVIKGKVKGGFAPFINRIPKALGRYFNVSFTTSTEGLGQLIEEERDGDVSDSGRYTGCLGMLQRNESDVQMPFTDFGTLGPGLRHTIPITSNRLLMTSAYNQTDSIAGKSDVLDAFLAFDSLAAAAVLVMTLSFILLFACLPRYSRNIRIRFTRRKTCESLATVTAVLLKQTSAAEIRVAKKREKQRRRLSRSASLSLLLLVLLFFAFLMIFYFSSMIKTEMVVPVKPVTLTTYEELLERGDVVPLFIKQMRDRAEAMEISLKGQASDVLYDVCVTSEKFRNISLIDGRLDAMFPVISGLVSQKSVMLTSSLVAPVIRGNVCTVIRKLLPDLRRTVFLTRDGDAGQASERLRTIMLAAAYPEAPARLLISKLQAIVEAAILARVLNELSDVVDKMPPFSRSQDDTVMEAKTDQSSQNQWKRECESNRILTPEGHDVSGPNLHHYRNLFTILLMAPCISYLLLVIERFTDRKLA